MMEPKKKKNQGLESYSMVNAAESWRKIFHGYSEKEREEKNDLKILESEKNIGQQCSFSQKKKFQVRFSVSVSPTKE